MEIVIGDPFLYVVRHTSTGDLCLSVHGYHVGFGSYPFTVGEVALVFPGTQVGVVYLQALRLLVH